MKRVFKYDLYLYPTEWIISFPVNSQICSLAATFFKIYFIYTILTVKSKCAKLPALRVLRVLVPYVSSCLTCPRALRVFVSYVPSCLTCLACPRALWSFAPTLTCLIITIFTKPSILDPWLVLTHSSYAAE